MAQGDLVQRMLGAATINIDTFEEVEADETATMQAAAVVAMVAVASTIGGMGGENTSLFFAPVAQILGWLVWAGVTYLIGAKIFGGTATWGELLRTLGFAQSPGVLYLAAVLPFVGGIIRLVVPFWMLWAGIVAIRQALDFGTGKAVLTAVVGWLAMIIPAAILAGLAASG
ncbi:MAG: YIP1 family protein [Gemmatimonadetes bacterium]|nr:YIP1 family protein [Gemmatimonadota bacterium]